MMKKEEGENHMLQTMQADKTDSSSLMMKNNLTIRMRISHIETLLMQLEINNSSILRG
jgi:hypothetical protein